jgi:hypothetical protein
MNYYADVIMSIVLFIGFIFIVFILKLLKEEVGTDSYIDLISRIIKEDYKEIKRRLNL